MAAEAPLVSYISKDQMLQVKNIAIAARSLVFTRDVGQNRCGPTCSVQGWTICKLQWQGGCLAAQVRRQALAHTQRMSSDIQRLYSYLPSLTVYSRMALIVFSTELALILFRPLKSFFCVFSG